MASAPLFGEGIYTPKRAWVAPYTYADGTYGTPVLVTELQTFNFNPVIDNDSRKAGGITKATLAVATHLDTTLSISTLDIDALAVMAGIGSSSSGSTPNRVRDAGLDGGGAGFPYHGVMVEYVAEGGASTVIGVPRNMLTAYPGISNEQNTYALYQLSGMGTANPYSTTPERLIVYKSYETRGDFTAPTAGSDLDTFFGVS